MDHENKPLISTLKQDLIHDNLVPKYSAIATATPNRLVLIGVWLIFGSMAFGSVAMLIEYFGHSRDSFTTIVSIIGPLFFLAISITILVQQTKRYVSRPRSQT